MLKITIQIQESKDKEKCTAKIIIPKDLSKASENERKAGAMVFNEIEKALKQIES